MRYPPLWFEFGEGACFFLPEPVQAFLLPFLVPPLLGLGGVVQILRCRVEGVGLKVEGLGRRVGGESDLSLACLLY